MPYQRVAVVFHKLELRGRALAANIAEIPHLEAPLARLNALLDLLRGLVAEQARLTSQRQEVTKRITERIDEAQKLLTFLDAGIRQHYGHRSEKLTAFGLQPFRSKPRGRKAGADGEPPTPNADEDAPEAQD